MRRETASGGSAAPAAVASEVHTYLRPPAQRRLYPYGVLVGLLAGLVAVAFRGLLQGAAELRNGLIRFAHELGPAGVLLPVAAGALTAGAAVWLVLRVAPETAGSGIPNVEAVLHQLRALSWRRVLPVKFVGGVLGIGGGLALGREGPTVQMGGALGQMVAGGAGSSPRERQALIAAGAGAGLAATFNAPLGGLIFVLEELRRDFSPAIFRTSFFACIVADAVTRLILGQSSVFRVAAPQVQPLVGLPLFMALGVAAGLLGVLFNRGLLAGLRLFDHAGGWPRGATGAVVGAGVGLVGWFLPKVIGGGDKLAEQTLAGVDDVLDLLPLYFVLRFALTMFSYGCGAPGGIFAPLLVLGAQLGLAAGLLGHCWLPEVVPVPTVYAVVGMAAYFAAIVRAPLTGLVLVLEMTGNYTLMLPLAVACATAAAVATLTGDKPIYESLLERALARGGPVAQARGTKLVELPVEPGSPFAGRRVGDLDLPPGCLIIMVEDASENRVATADTVLNEGDLITVLVPGEDTGAAARLRAGTMGLGATGEPPPA